MKLLSAGLTFVNVAAFAGLLLGILGNGLDAAFAQLALFTGIAAAIVAYLTTSPFSAAIPLPPAPPPPQSKRARRRMKLEPVTVAPPRPYQHLWAWVVAIVFAVFAFRSFCWLIYIDGANLKIQSPFNLGDLALHVTYIKYFAHGIALWPDNPISFSGGLRYPAGIDLFNALLLCLHLDLIHVLVWTGLLGSLATFYAFYRWGGAFAVAGFLFNGGLTGFQFFKSFQFADYQAEGIAWKSLPLTMFVTQRGLLYSIPAGLLLLLHWRRKFFPNENETAAGARRGLVPWWVEWSLYAFLPLFHVHTFLALSIVLAFWLLIGTAQTRKEIGLLLAAAFLPASWIIWMITDHFQAKSVFAFAPGWLQSDPAYSTSPINFWILNFGLTLPALIALGVLVGWRVWKNKKPGWISRYDSFAFVAPAAAIFLFALLVKTAPWDWDNIKIIIWAYFLCLPFLWRDLIAKWPQPVRAGICVLLFTSGFVSLFGGLAEGKPGFDLADRFEVNAVATVTGKLPIADRFAAFPTYNHPLLLNGRKVTLGYPAHAWTQGFDYASMEQQVKTFMLGPPDWRERARALHARYLFWGPEEKRAYASSAQPWRGRAAIVATGFWGTIYDLEQAAPILRQDLRPRTGPPLRSIED